MYAPLKDKSSRKVKEKTRVSIEEGIPEVPRLSDFNLTDCANANEENETIEENISELVNAVDELDLDSKNQNENSEEQCSSHLDTQSEKEKQIVDSPEVVEEKNGDLADIGCPQVLESEGCTQNEDVAVDNDSEESKPSDDAVVSQKIEESAEANNYYNLSTEVKTLIEEISEPSAPAVEGGASIHKSNVESMENANKESTALEKPVDISKYNFTLVVEDFLKPFTEEKLSEFYYNAELQESKNYINEFIHQELDNGTKKDNKLYKLLVEYMQSKNSLKANATKAQDLKEKLKVCMSSMWTVWDNVEVTEKEKCSDGNVVTFVEKYTQAQFNTKALKEFTSLLKQLKHVAYEAYILDSYKCSVARLKIEYYLQCLLKSCPEFTSLQEESSAVLTSSSMNSHFQQCLIDLKIAISVLFIFQRKQSLDVDSSFLKETRQWLSDLVSVLLRVGSWKDHIFILSHIMRCPGGVSEWAAQFVQLPFSKILIDPFSNNELDHMMTVLSVLLGPVEQRENFIKKWESELASDVNPWTVIDSDGEDEDDDQQSCPFKENDLVLFLNQIPFSHLFKSLLRYDCKEISTVTSDYLLKLFSFFTNLIKILLCGLKLYCTERYRQFAKRLGRLIYHIVQYATDLLVIFKSQSVSDSEMMRIQVEYDSFFLRASKFIFTAKKYGTWQFLATLPYNMISTNTILKLYGILQLNEDQEESIIKVNFSTFENKFLQLPEEEQFYLLTTFANMALARDIIEIQFIKNIVLQLFYVGFLNLGTMEHCYKNVKSLLYSICSSYPFLMSEILFIQKNMFLSNPDQDQKLTTYLWLKLPIDMWCPEKKDFDTIASWLLEPLQSSKNELARIILQSLNYGIIQGEVFIPVENQRIIAMLILKANTKLLYECDAGVIKNVSSLVCSPTPEQIMIDWTWNILLKLRLHLLDHSEAEFCKRLCNLGDYLKNIPDVESDIELHHLVLKKHPAATFIALMTTTLGHSVPIVFDKGFELIEVLLNAGKYEAGISCLEYMTLLFLDCSDSLYKCEKFIYLLSSLIAADNSYVQFAKNLISNNFPGPVLKCLENMLQNQLNYCRNINFKNFSNIMELWLLSLTRLPLWMQEPGVLYLIDRLLQNSFFDVVSTKTVSAILEDLLEANSPPSETKSSFSNLVNWMNSKYVPPSLLPKGFNGEVPWFSYKIIYMEYEIFEKKTSIWTELLKELHSSSDKKANVDNSLKKVCNSLKIPVRPSSVLSIYKWSYQILETDLAHPLIPLMWQRFFSLFLHRVPGSIDRGSVGMKFFDGVINQGLFKRLKQRLQETCNYFKTFTEESEESIDFDYFSRCFKIFQTYSLWLDDPKLQEPCLSIHMLPIQYNPELLGLLLHGSETPWIEFLEYRKIEENFRNGSSAWLRLKNRHGSQKGSKTLSHKKEKSIMDRLTERLNSYEVPLVPPRIDFKNYNFPRVNFDILINSDKMILFVKPYLKILLEYIREYTSNVNENISLGCDMQELLPRLYLNSECQKVLKAHCSGVNKTLSGKSVHYACSGPAFVKLTFQESKLNGQVKQHMSQCEKAFEDNLQKALSSLPKGLIMSAVLIDTSIEELKREYFLASRRDAGDQIISDLRGTGVHLFYEFVRTWCESITHTPPLEKAFEDYIDALGKSFVEGNAEENDRILHLIINDGLFGEKISKYFTPNASTNHDFIENYSKALSCTSERRFIILSKFDLVLWLSDAKPKFSERSRLISAVGRGLKIINGQSEDKHTLKLLNQHLEILLMYDFPEHYGEILNFLILASETQSIPTSTWFTFLNSLAFGHFSFAEGRTDQNIFEPGQSIKKLKYYFSKFATDQNLIPFDVIKGTITLLASHFKSERVKIGAYGLYRKYKLYSEPLFIFFGMLSYSWVAKALEIDTGSLSDKLAQQLWPLISDLYSPWLVPYWVENDKVQNAQWMQEQNIDRCIHLPWVMNESCHASFCASIFSESVRFIFDALPGLNHVLSYTWFFYVTNFAHIYVKDYILNVVHDSLVSLPWETFVPSLQDVELMLKVVDQFLPLSHSFLGSIFVNIKWTELVQYYLGCYDVETTSKLHICLLHLLVKLPLEPSLKQNEKVTALLAEANEYAWHLVDSSSYDIVLNWFIMSCDPRIILMDERLEYFKLDSTILRLLQACAGYVPSAKAFHPTTLTKRLMFVRACVKWLITSNRRFKCKDSPLFKAALRAIWSEMETVISETVPPQQRVDEAGILLSESLTIFSEPELSSIVEYTLTDWLSTRRSNIITFGLFRSAGVSIENPRIFGSIVESSLDSYFGFTDNSDWSEINKTLVSFSKTNSDILLKKVLIDHNYFLTLYAILLIEFQRNENGFRSELILTDLLQLFSDVKLSSELEPKLTLLIAFGLKLAESEMKLNLKDGILYLVKFCNTLNNFVNDKGNGFLSAIGLKKSPSSNRFRLICLIACSGIIIFLKNNYPDYEENVDEKILQALESVDSNKAFQSIQQYASYAKNTVKDMTNLDQIVNFLKHIGLKLFNKLYLK